MPSPAHCRGGAPMSLSTPGTIPSPSGMHCEACWDIGLASRDQAGLVARHCGIFQ